MGWEAGNALDRWTTQGDRQPLKIQFTLDRITKKKKSQAQGEQTNCTQKGITLITYYWYNNLYLISLENCLNLIHILNKIHTKTPKCAFSIHLKWATESADLRKVIAIHWQCQKSKWNLDGLFWVKQMPDMSVQALSVLYAACQKGIPVLLMAALYPRMSPLWSSWECSCFYFEWLCLTALPVS